MSDALSTSAAFDDEVRAVLTHAYRAHAMVRGLEFSDSSLDFMAARTLGNIRARFTERRDILLVVNSALATIPAFLQRLERSADKRQFQTDFAVSAAIALIAKADDCVFPHCSEVP